MPEDLARLKWLATRTESYQSVSKAHSFLNTLLVTPAPLGLRITQLVLNHGALKQGRNVPQRLSLCPSLAFRRGDEERFVLHWWQMAQQYI